LYLANTFENLLFILDITLSKFSSSFLYSKSFSRFILCDKLCLAIILDRPLNPESFSISFSNFDLRFFSWTIFLSRGVLGVLGVLGVRILSLILTSGVISFLITFSY